MKTFTTISRLGLFMRSVKFTLILSLSLVSGYAMATDCRALITEFQNVYNADPLSNPPTDEQLARHSQAKDLFSQGMVLCQAGQNEEAVSVLQQAISTINAGQ